MHFILGGEPGKPPSSLLAASETQFPGLLSSPESCHRHKKTTRQSQPYTGTNHPLRFRGRVTVAGSSPNVVLQNPTLEAENETGVIQCGSRLCRCLSPSLLSLWSPGWHWPPGSQNPRSTRMGITGLSHCSNMALLLCPKLTLAHSPLLQLPAAHSNFCSHIFIFQSAAGSWTSEQQGLDARWQTHLSVFSVGPGSSYIWFLSSRTLSPVPVLSPHLVSPFHFLALSRRTLLNCQSFLSCSQ